MFIGRQAHKTVHNKEEHNCMQNQTKRGRAPTDRDAANQSIDEAERNWVGNQKECQRGIQRVLGLEGGGLDGHLCLLRLNK